MHGEPVDRVIAGTAITLEVALVTADRMLRESQGLETVWWADGSR
jgi:PIN domain nuclease of toxin-antitoxin system